MPSVAGGPAESWQREIHERLVHGDIVAPAEAAETLLAPLVRRLRGKHPGLADPQLVDQAVATALMSYFRQPAQFDPARATLFHFLLLAADRDLRNELAKLRRRREKEAAFAVELARQAGNEITEGCEAKSQAATVELSRRMSRMVSLFGDTRDRAMARLILDGERSTAAYAALLGLHERPVEEQRREVKRHKDRIKQRWRRAIAGER
jgi:hypothetical protein